MRKQFSKSDIKAFIEQFPPAQQVMDKKSNVAQDDDVLLVNNQPLFLHIDGAWVPSLKLLLQKPDLLPKVVVDKGAIRFVVNGADIMRPGIVFADQWSANSKGTFVVVVDETVGKPIAVGKCALSGEQLLQETSGKHVKNLHYIGDKYWNA